MGEERTVIGVRHVWTWACRRAGGGRAYHGGAGGSVNREPASYMPPDTASPCVGERRGAEAHKHTSV